VPAPSEFRKHEPGLNRLAETNFISDEHASRATQDREGWLQLVRQQIDTGVDSREREPNVRRSRDEPGDSSDCVLWPNVSETRGSHGGGRPIEWREKGQTIAAVFDVQAYDVPVQPRVFDAPPPLTNPDAGSW
jgi:hypothetical protein